jgi:Tol biopolymer transport system component
MLMNPGARAISPDGRWLAPYNEKGIWRMALAGGDPILITKMQGRFAKWFPDGRSIVFVYGANLWQATVDGKAERPLTNFVGRRGYLEQDPATDGRYVYFSWREDISDIWVMDVVSPGRR